MKLTTAQIGKCGELLVQYRLLLLGIESAPMSTDSGIDLVAYAPYREHPATIQVKTNLKPKASGGKGKLGIDWWLPENSPAELVAFANLESQTVWIMSHMEVQQYAQQHSKGKYHLYMYTDPTVLSKKNDRPMHTFEFEAFRLENRVHKLFYT